MTDATEEKGQDQKQKKQRQRSPSYPAHGLETCFKWARKMYDSERKSTTAALVAVKYLGFATLSGPSRVALSCLKKFGLMVEDGTERVRISDDAVRLFLAPTETERLNYLRSHAKRPEIIKELVEEYSGGLPSDATLKFNLVSNRGFGEEAADTFIAAFKETISFAQLGSDEYHSDETMAAEGQQVEQSMVPPQGRPVASAPVARTSGPQNGSTPSPAARAPLRFELSDGNSVDIHASVPFTADTFEELLDFLKVYEKVLKKRPVVAVGSPRSSGQVDS